MRGKGLLLRPLAVTAMALLLGGCPLFQRPQLNVAPKAISFGEDISQQFLNITNLGTGTLSWTIDEVVRANADAPWVPQPVAFLSVDTASGTTTGELDRVTLTINRNGLPVGVYNNIGVRISANGATEIVPVAFVVRPTLSVSPAEFALQTNTASAAFTVSNTGSAQAAWEVLFLPDPSNLESATALPEDFRIAPNPASTAPGGTTTVSVQWNAGRTDFNLLLSSEAGDAVLSFRFGGALDGLQVTPSALRLFISGTEVAEGEQAPEQPVSPVTITNTSGVSRNWSVSIRALNAAADTSAIAIAPASGSTAPAQESKIDVSVRNIETVSVGSGNYELLITSGDSFFVVPIIVEIRQLPIITISEPPDPAASRPEIIEFDVLDLGRDEISGEFWVANTGPRGSRLSFKIEHDDQDLPEGTSPLIIDVTPLQGNTNQGDPDFFFPPGTNELIDAAPISVTVDRTALVEDVEYRDIRIVAYDDDLTTPLEAVEVATIRVRVERQPLTIEGAVNRSRPPFLVQFVFLMRDSLSQVIPTRTPEDRARINFSIQEDEVPLDLNETNSFVTGPENLKVNLVLLLDYTGSLYNAGTDNPSNPLPKGAVVEQVRQAAIRFLDDLPPGYRVALMYHNDRQQQNRLIANFTTDRDALKTALRNFSVPASLFGTTTVRDALVDAMARLTAEDADETLPFDDADLRAVVFVTDGRDNSSVASISEVQDAAEDSRTRLYPLIYSAGSPSNIPDMLELATESGGHLYNAGEATNLAALLDSEKGLKLDPASTSTANAASFTLTNSGTAAFNWSAAKENPGDTWISQIVDSVGTLEPGQSVNVRVQVNPALIGLNTTRSGEILITTDNDSGEGTVEVQAAVGADISTATSVRLALRDNPGQVWADLRNQIVLTYITPQQDEGTYLVTASYQQPQGGTIAGSFQRDMIFFPGDVRTGQISLVTDGIIEDLGTTDAAQRVRAEVYVRCDYAPRDVNRFRLRFFPALGDAGNLPAGAAAALAQAQIRVELAPQGLLSAAEGRDAWRLLEEPDGSYVILTDEDNALRYGAAGNLLRITISNLADFRDLFAGLAQAPEFFLGMRVDNQIYVDPATPEEPSRTKYFLYPGGPTYPGRFLAVSTTPDLAPPAQFAVQLQIPGIDFDNPIDPEAPNAWDQDEDGFADYNDPVIDDEDFPSTLATPNPVTINATQAAVTVTVRNERLDTFSWSLVAASVPAFLSADFTGADFTLAPGQTTQFVLNANRTGLANGFYNATLRIDTDLFAEEEIPVTLVVATP